MQNLTKKIILDAEGLTIEDVYNIVMNNYKLQLSDVVKKKILLARKAIEKAVEANDCIYGITTGFGALRDIVIPEEDAIELQLNLIRSHSVGVGEPLDDKYVKAMMVLRVAALARGNSGCQLKTLENLVMMINRNVLPVIPSKGSVGASGDLAPLSHMALAMIGEGKNNLKFNRTIYDAKEGLKQAGIPITELSYKEGLALNNGAQFSAGIACLVIADGTNVLETAELSAALSMEALRAARQQFDERIHLSRHHPGQMISGKKILKYTEGSKLVKIHQNIFHCQKCGYYYDYELGDESQKVPPGTKFEALEKGWHCPNCGTAKHHFKEKKLKVQDDYSLRCHPQVIGPIRETLDFVKTIIQREINAATDNPLIFIKNESPLEFDVYSGGNFHGEPIALAMDYLGIAMAEVGNISERRIAKLINCHRNEGLSSFLIHSKSLGLNNGYMMPQYTAAALVSENKGLAFPASVDSIPTSAEAEDHVSMSPIAARQVKAILENLKYIIGIELLLAVQAIDLRCEIQKVKPEKVLGKKTLLVYKYIRSFIPKLTKDRILYPEIEQIAEKIQDGSILATIKNSGE